MNEFRRKLGTLALILTLPSMALASPDHYIYEADVELFDDLDGDGFYRFLSVRIDADSLRDSAWVYAELYLSPDGVNWEHYHSTDDFWIGGATGDDEYFVETELLSGYPTGRYDLLIELYDADFLTYSDEFGPAQSAGLSLLPLEDATRDPEQVVVVVEHGGGGAFSLGWLGLLALAAIRRRRFAAGKAALAPARPLSGSGAFGRFLQLGQLDTATIR